MLDPKNCSVAVEWAFWSSETNKKNPLFGHTGRIEGYLRLRETNACESKVDNKEIQGIMTYNTSDILYVKG